jgi:diguanylate cyclase (GGDEF)-like protein
VVATGLTVAAALTSLILTRAAVPLDVLHALSLLLIAIATYAWVVFGRGVSLLLSVGAILEVSWAWAVRREALLGADLAALAVLLTAAGWQARRRVRQRHRLTQVLDDLREEDTVKAQAAALATQTRDALQKKHARYAQLQAIGEQLSNMTDLQAIAALAVERAFALIGKSDASLLFLVERNYQELALFASKRREGLPAIRAKHGDQFDRYVLRTQRPLLVNDVRRDFRFTVGLAQERPVSSVIACPLLIGQRAEGLLRLDAAQAGAYTQDDLRFLDILLDLAATAVANARLFAQTQQLAMLDGLTGLLLRRPFLEQLTRELARAARSREPVAVLLADVDHFKAYNDGHGHTAGDLVLKGVADVLRHAVPPEGVSARYGGEEFAVFLPRTKRTAGADVAEAIRRGVEQQFRAGGRQAARPLTISIGVASFPDDATGDLELIRMADQRLYEAKHAGRNLVCAS